MRVFIAAGHGGFQAKVEVIDILEQLNCDFEDLGSYELDADDDYPVYAKKVCEKVLKNENSVGILICGSGTGMQIAANKFQGIRAAFCYDEYSAKMARLDNNVNVLTLREREFDHSKYYGIIRMFLDTEFSDEDRHKRRLNLIKHLEVSWK